MDTCFCVGALEKAVETYSCPEIFKAQGRQFANVGFTDVFKDHQIQISMDGKVHRVDSVSVKRLWPSMKYREVYLKAYDTAHSTKR